MARRRDRRGSGDDNLSVRTDVDDSGVERPAGAAVTGPKGVEAPAVTGHDVPASDEEAVAPPEADEDSAEQNLDRPAVRPEKSWKKHGPEA